MFSFDWCLYIGVYAGLCLLSADSISLASSGTILGDKQGHPLIADRWRQEDRFHVWADFSFLLNSGQSSGAPQGIPWDHLAVYECPFLGPVWPLLTTEGGKVAVGVSRLPSGDPLTSTWRVIWGSCHRWARGEGYAIHLAFADKSAVWREKLVYLCHL